MVQMTDVRQQAVTGLVPPELGEALIRQVWPSVSAFPAVARLGRVLQRTIVLAPFGWLLLAPFYFLKVLPGLGRRYRLTNRRLMICRGVTAQPSKEVALAKIDDVRIVEDENSPFYRAATLEIFSGEQLVLRLPGVPGPEAFRQAILNAVRAWVPEKTKTLPFIPASAAKSSK